MSHVVHARAEANSGDMVGVDISRDESRLPSNGVYLALLTGYTIREVSESKVSLVDQDLAERVPQ
jgi:hypothetical protein